MNGVVTARRLVCNAFGDVDDLVVVTGPLPTVGTGQVLVEVTAAGVGFVDSLIVRGLYQVRPPLPFTPGAVIAGSVVQAGEDVSDFPPGVLVAALLAGMGGYASHVVVDATAAMKLPEGVSPVTAVSALESYGTLEFAVSERVSIQNDEWVVVLGAGGGIGLAAVDVAHGLGARVVAVASSPEKRSAAVAAGAMVALDYADLKNQIQSETGGGADVVIDPVGGPSSEAALRALRAGGRLCVLGFAAGDIPRLPANVVLVRNRSVVGVDWGDKVRTDPAAAAAMSHRVLEKIAAGQLHPHQPTTFPLVEASKALRLLVDRAVTGKIALLP